MTLLNTLYSFPLSGIIALEHKRSKKIYITSSTNIASSIGRIVSDIKKNEFHIKEVIDDFKNLEFHVLETVNDTKELKLKKSYWMFKYGNMKYKLYDTRLPVEYRVRIQIDSFYHKINVVLVNKRNDKLVIGVFNTPSEATSWIDYTFKEGEFVTPIYCNNELTKAHVLKHRIN